MVDYGGIRPLFLFLSMKSFTRKKESLNELKSKADAASVILFASFARAGEKGVNVSDMTQLRRELRKTGSELVIEKKTILQKMMKDSKKNFSVEGIQGSIGAVFSSGDELGICKSLYGFAKTHPGLMYFGGISGTRVLSAADITELAKLPGREVLLGQIVGMMTYPIRSFMSVVSQLSEKQA